MQHSNYLKLKEFGKYHNIFIRRWGQRNKQKMEASTKLTSLKLMGIASLYCLHWVQAVKRV